MGIFDAIGKGFKWIGQKVATGLDYTIQGLKIASDFADKYTLGLTHFIPYYSAIKAGIDIADHVRKMAKGEEKFGFGTALDMGTDELFGAMRLGSGASELKGVAKGAEKFAEYGKAGTSTGFRLRGATREVLKGYGVHKSQISQGIKSLGRFGKMVKDGHPKQVLQAVAGGTALAGTGAVAVGASQEQDQRRSAMPQPKPRVLTPYVAQPDNSDPPTTKSIVPRYRPIPNTTTDSAGNVRNQYGAVIGNTM